MNVLFHYGALGDFVLTLTLMRALPGQTTLVTAWPRATLASRMLDDVHPMDIQMWEFMRLHAKGGPTSVSPAVGDLFSKAPTIISFISSGDDDWANNIARLAPQANRVFIDPRPRANDPRAKEGWTKHICDWHRQQAHDQGLALSQPALPKLSQVSDGPVVVHPGSGGADKCWPAKRYEDLIDALTGRGLRVLPLLGETEAERWPDDRLDHWCRKMNAKVFGTLDELHQALAGASAYIGNDSGPTHLAAQLGLPTIALFGPTDSTLWAPIGPSVTVLAPPTPTPMNWLSVDAVLDAYPVHG